MVLPALPAQLDRHTTTTWSTWIFNRLPAELRGVLIVHAGEVV
jgi:hypothetical protein